MHLNPKVMKNNLVRLALYISIALVPIGCGTRKANVKIDNFKESVRIEEKSVGKVEKSEAKTETISKKEQVAKVEENQEQRITELYFENGILRSRVFEITNHRIADSSTKDESSVITLIIRQDSLFNNTRTIDRTIKIHSKEKNTQRSNNGIYWMLGAVVGFGILVYAVYKFIVRKR